MRCIECVTEPITPGHFCECCGRKLSLEERKGLDATAVTAPPPSRTAAPVDVQAAVAPVVSPEPAPAVVACESCGGPSDEGTLCAKCRQVFQPFLNSVPPQSEWSAPAAAPASQAAGVQQPPHFDPVVLESALEAAAARPEAVEVAPKSDVAPLRAEAVKTEAAKPDVNPETKPQAVAHESTKLHAVPVESATIKAVPAEKPRPAPKAPAPPAKRPAASVQTRRRADWMIGIAAAVAVVAAIGVGWGAFWVKVQHEPVAPQPASSSAPAAAPAAEVATVRPEVAEAAARVQADLAARERAAAQPPAAVKARAAAASATSPKTQPKNVRQPAAPAPQVASVAAPARVEPPVREVEAPVPAPVSAPSSSASAAAAAASIAPQRPFFEPKDVNEAPQVASRVDPRVPDDLQSRSVSDVVVVRLLVSQTGHPSSISLLRKSKSGQSLDDAVVAAVRQWTFSPAKKKGEAVSCWMNVGVPVGKAN